MSVVYITRRATFCSAHRLYSPHLTQEENEITYGKCCLPNGHGHNYTVEVTLKGKIDPHTGMVMNLHHLKQVVENAIMTPLDHKNIDKDVEYFSGHVSTVENIAVFIWHQMLQALDDKKYLLYEVKLHETENNICIYRGE